MNIKYCSCKQSVANRRTSKKTVHLMFFTPKSCKSSLRSLALARNKIHIPGTVLKTRDENKCFFHIFLSKLIFFSSFNNELHRNIGDQRDFLVKYDSNIPQNKKCLFSKRTTSMIYLLSYTGYPISQQKCAVCHMSVRILCISNHSRTP